MRAFAIRCICVAAVVGASLPLAAHAQLCVGRPGAGAHHIPAGVHLQSGNNAVSVVPRVGTSIRPVFATLGIGNRTFNHGGGYAVVYQGEVGVTFGGPSPKRAQWCPVFRAERQQGPNNDFSSVEVQMRSEKYRFGWSFGEVLGGTVQEPGPYIFVGSFAYERGWSSVTTSALNNYTSESTVGFVAGIGLHVMLRRWLSAGANAELPLWATGSKPPLGIGVAASF